MHLITKERPRKGKRVINRMRGKDLKDEYAGMEKKRLRRKGKVEREISKAKGR